jgi:hypothetical protein
METEYRPFLSLLILLFLLFPASLSGGEFSFGWLWFELQVAKKIQIGWPTPTSTHQARDLDKDQLQLRSSPIR